MSFHNKEVKRKGAKTNNKSECGKTSEHNMVIKSSREQIAMQDVNYQKVITKTDDMDIVFEYPILEENEEIVKDVKSILFSILQEQIINTV